MIVRQRGDQDCGIACLAMYAEVSYEDAYVAVTRVDRVTRGKRGLDNRELVRAAKYLGIVLVPTRKFDLDDDEGILRVRWNGKANAKANPGGHYVVVLEGRVLCPKDSIGLAWRDYLERNDGRLGTLLRGPA